MRKIVISLIVIILFITTVKAQDVKRCGLNQKLNEKIIENPDVINKRQEINILTQQWIENNINEKSYADKSIITIPVVVHVLYSNSNENISNAQIMSEFDVLNADYRKLNSDHLSNTPSAFQSLAADCEIEFCLASIDPSGNTTSGITRTSVSANFDFEYDYYNVSNGGAPAWNTSNYLNVWIVNLGDNLLGFAYPPGVANSDEDGVVIDYRAWGTIEQAIGNAPYNKGRTATHEIGHYLNLEHPWGPGNGGCGEDDFVSDTPLQETESYDCGPFPMYDNCTSTGNGIMFMNFMDYSDDACMGLFTNGQKNRIMAALNNNRSGLLNSVVCSSNTSVEELNNNHYFKVYQLSDKIFEIKSNVEQSEVFIYNILGEVVYSDNTYGQNKKITLNNIDAGVYIVRFSSNEMTYSKKIIVR